MKRLTIILVFLTLLSCEKENIEPIELIDYSINPNLTLIESGKDYDLTYILGYEPTINAEEISSIEIKYHINGRKTFMEIIESNIDSYVLNVSGETLIDEKINPESIEILIYGLENDLLASDVIPFKYSGNYNDDFISKHYSSYPVEFVSPITEIVIDSVYTLEQITQPFEFDLPITCVRIEFFDEKLNVTHSYYDRFNYYHQFPGVRFNVSDHELSEYNISYVKFNYMYLVEEINEFMTVSQNMIIIE